MSGDWHNDCSTIQLPVHIRASFVMLKAATNGNVVRIPLRRLWAAVGLAAAVLINGAWIGLLGYALIQLL